MKHYKKLAPVSVMLGSFMLFCYFAYFIIQHPYIGIDVEKSGDDYFVKEVASTSWGNRSEVQMGDIVLSINDMDPSEYITVQRSNTIEQAFSLELLRNGEKKQMLIDTRMMDHYYIYHLVFPVFLYISCLAMCFFLLVRKNSNRIVNSLIYLLNLLGISLISAGSSTRQDLMGEYTVTFSLIFSLVLFLHFLYLYFVDYQVIFIRKGFIYKLYIVGLLLFISDIALINMNLIPIHLTFFILLMLMVYLLILKLYRRFRETSNKQVIQIIIVGLTLSFVPFASLYVIPNVLFNQPLVPAEFTTICMVILPFTLVYLVVSEEVIDMDFVIRKNYYSGIVSFVATTLIIIGFLLLNPSNMIHTIEIIRLSIIIFIVVSSILYFKDRLDFLLRKKLYPKRKDYQISLNRFLHAMKSEVKIENLLFSLRKELETNLPIRSINYFQRVEVIEIGTIHKQGSVYKVALSEEGSDFLIIEIELEQPVKQLNIEEMVWLETILHYAQLMINNLQKLEEVMGKLEQLKSENNIPMHVSKLLLSIADQERKSLARDLHDTILQEQLMLAGKVDHEIKHIKDKSVPDLLTEIRESLLDQAHILREVTNDLHPVFLHELGLHQSLRALFEKVNLRSNFMLYSHIAENISLTNKEYVLAVYRIIQELLNNAMEHAKATNVHLDLVQKDDWIYLDYYDNGIGCDMKILEGSFHTRGILGMRERVRGINGTFNINTQEGEGFKVEISFRVK